MATVTLQGNPIETIGELPAPGSQAPAFTLVQGDLSELTSESLVGKRVILNIFPSIDTPTCATSTRRFNEELASLDNTAVLCVSADLPFAQKRFCGSEGLDRVKTASTFRSTFSDDYGVTVLTGIRRGLTARVVVVIDPAGIVKHVELVEEVSTEPDYEAVLAVL